MSEPLSGVALLGVSDPEQLICAYGDCQRRDLVQRVTLIWGPTGKPLPFAGLCPDHQQETVNRAEWSPAPGSTAW